MILRQAVQVKNTAPVWLLWPLDWGSQLSKRSKPSLFLLCVSIFRSSCNILIGWDLLTPFSSFYIIFISLSSFFLIITSTFKRDICTLSPPFPPRFASRSLVRPRFPGVIILWLSYNYYYILLSLCFRGCFLLTVFFYLATISSPRACKVVSRLYVRRLDCYPCCFFIPLWTMFPQTFVAIVRNCC